MLSSPQFPASMPLNPTDHSGLITQCLSTVRQQLAEAAAQHGRDPATVRLMAVSKQQSVADIAAAAHARQRDFGESYLQEALPKIQACNSLGLTWHFIGQVQSNKTRPIAEHFDWLHTLDRDKIAQRLNDQRPHFGLGDATSVDSLEIHWPSGFTQLVALPSVDRFFVVEEGKGVVQGMYDEPSKTGSAAAQAAAKRAK